MTPLYFNIGNGNSAPERQNKYLLIQRPNWHRI